MNYILVSELLNQVNVREDTCTVIPWCQPYSWRSELRASAKRHLTKVEEEEEAVRRQEEMVRRVMAQLGEK